LDDQTLQDQAGCIDLGVRDPLSKAINIWISAASPEVSHSRINGLLESAEVQNRPPLLKTFFESDSGRYAWMAAFHPLRSLVAISGDSL
jgi:hypothetical protein